MNNFSMDGFERTETWAQTRVKMINIALNYDMEVSHTNTKRWKPNELTIYGDNGEEVILKVANSTGKGPFVKKFDKSKYKNPIRAKMMEYLINRFPGARATEKGSKVIIPMSEYDGFAAITVVIPRKTMR